MARRKKLFSDKEMVELFGEIDEPSPPAPPPPQTATVDGVDGWMPDLNPTQRLIFDDTSLFVLAHAEKASGKTICMAHKIVRHAYENENALGMIIAPSIRTGVEGIWHDLDTLVLPAWKEGIGLEFGESKLDSATKDRHRWVANRFGGWSKLLVMSIPYAAAVQSRVKGPAPSCIVVDELTNCESRDYFTYSVAQLGRRRGIHGPQQFLASCNPEGPSHWVHDVFFKEPVNQETGERDPNFAVYHVPIAENVHRLPQGYVERLLMAIKDPIERQRLLYGIWVDRPSGDAIFKDYFFPEMHVKGNAILGVGLTPKPGYPIIIGYDPGPVNFSVHFIQAVPIKDKVFWLVFDEINFVGRRTMYHVVVSAILNRMEHWNEFCKTKFGYEHIADEAAFSHKDRDGSFDAREIELMAQGKIRMRPCPKGKGSVAARVRMVMAMLLNNQLYVSSLCPKTIEMFAGLQSEKQTPGEWEPDAGFKPVRSQHLHPFDSLTYGMFYFFANNLTPSATQTERIEPQVFSCGQR